MLNAAIKNLYSPDYVTSDSEHKKTNLTNDSDHSVNNILLNTSDKLTTFSYSEAVSLLHPVTVIQVACSDVT